jgi:hypothetical protein
LVGYFLGSKLHYAAVNTIAHKIWEKAGLSEVLSFDLIKAKNLWEMKIRGTAPGHGER